MSYYEECCFSTPQDIYDSVNDQSNSLNATTVVRRKSTPAIAQVLVSYIKLDN